MHVFRSQTLLRKIHSVEVSNDTILKYSESSNVAEKVNFSDPEKNRVYVRVYLLLWFALFEEQVYIGRNRVSTILEYSVGLQLTYLVDALKTMLSLIIEHYFTCVYI